MNVQRFLTFVLLVSLAIASDASASYSIAAPPSYTLYHTFFTRNYSDHTATLYLQNPTNSTAAVVLDFYDLTGGGGITSVKASYKSIYGKIISDWKNEGRTFTLNVTIPANTTATVYVPAGNAESVTEGGQPASKAETVQFLCMEGDKAVFAIGSGQYRFVSKLGR